MCQMSLMVNSTLCLFDLNKRVKAKRVKTGWQKLETGDAGCTAGEAAVETEGWFSLSTWSRAGSPATALRGFRSSGA